MIDRRERLGLASFCGGRIGEELVVVRGVHHGVVIRRMRTVDVIGVGNCRLAVRVRGILVPAETLQNVGRHVHQVAGSRRQAFQPLGRQGAFLGMR